MAGISKRMDKQGNIISYRIRVSRGRKIDGTMRKPFEMSWPDTKKGESIPSGWSQARIEKKVKEIAILFEEKCKKGNVIAEKWRFQEYADYVIDLKCESGNIKKSTKNRYKELLGRINDEDNDGIGHLYLDRITAADLNKLYKRLGQDGQNKITGGKLSLKTILEHHRVISSVLEHAEKEGFVKDNVAKKATAPRPPRKDAECFSIEEMKYILNALGKEELKWQAIGNLLLALGARRGEIAGIKWENVDFKHNTIMLCNNLLYTPEDGIYIDTLKTEDQRTLSVSPEAMQILSKYRMKQEERMRKLGDRWIDTGFVFTKWNGEPIHPDSITRWCTKFKKKNNMATNNNPHKYRHSQASLLIDQKIDIVKVSKRLGHKLVSTTLNIYAHLLNKGETETSKTISNVLYNCSTNDNYEDIHRTYMDEKKTKNTILNDMQNCKNGTPKILYFKPKSGRKIHKDAQ